MAPPCVIEIEQSLISPEFAEHAPSKSLGWIENFCFHPHKTRLDMPSVVAELELASRFTDATTAVALNAHPLFTIMILIFTDALPRRHFGGIRAAQPNTRQFR